ncbi:hypothetical protein NEH83_37020 [Streptomyces sp. JUS-F4]|uniref:hypothetical protein n=1 Tax=Streptomyces sp. JUS-F4 TaxID=2951988 RepID=UPI0015E17699|nr:hypothetical protein [Streptomyces sp. JUS-F4]WKN12733.1 hypothetical protein NEH83_00035 [Streptomyces sp. JUS-F4]WKN19292.1 hypothetical protein NEH83_37020 [Streptomyces sp. JUS-F4]
MPGCGTSPALPVGRDPSAPTSWLPLDVAVLVVGVLVGLGGTTVIAALIIPIVVR